MKLATSFFALATAALAVTASLTGCAADAAVDPSDDAEETEASADELTAAGKKLIGSYVDDTGAFRGLVLTQEKVGQANKFFADVDTGIRCITTPCPSSERIEGTFTAGTKTITLKSSTAVNGKHLLGKYSYLVQGSKLSLFRKDFAQSLSKERSYCAQSNDCYRQDIIHPMCLGQFSCASNACVWRCGPPLPPASAVCLSSASCAAGEHCSVEDGVCNPYGMLAVCAGNCVAGAK
ncbi:MAG: hypothetical protein JST00_11505 [Deltaproteobacteria bacterium]|nr:hypothetical protein [Deltaproteobacteria bacterium]